LRKFVYLFLFFGAIILIAGCGASRKESISLRETNKNIVQKACGQCHSLKVGEKYIVKSADKPEIHLLKGKDREGWSQTVRRMINTYGCNVEEKDFGKIVDFLYKEAGPDNAVSASATDDEELVKIACGTCHGIVIIDATNPNNIIMRVTKSPLGGDIKIPAGKQDWSETVRRMIEKNGCAIPGGTQGQIFTRIVNWLNTNVGPNVGQHLDPNTATGQKLTGSMPRHSHKRIQSNNRKQILGHKPPPQQRRTRLERNSRKNDLQKQLPRPRRHKRTGSRQNSKLPDKPSHTDTRSINKNRTRTNTNVLRTMPRPCSSQPKNNNESHRSRCNLT